MTADELTDVEDVIDEDVPPADVDPFAWRPVRRRGLGRALSEIVVPDGPVRLGKGLGALIPTEARAKAAPRRRPAGFAAAPVPAPAPPPPVEVPVEVPPAVLAATLSAPRRIETEWLAAPELDAALHHADLGLHAVHDLALDEQHRVGPASAILLGCGRITRAVSFPAPWQRTDAERCPACCAALGYPGGVGSPVNDDGCRAVLAPRFGALG